MSTETFKWIWRDGEKSYKEFSFLSSIAKQEYLQQLQQLPKEELSSTDIIILNRYNIKLDEPIKFLEL